MAARSKYPDAITRQGATWYRAKTAKPYAPRCLQCIKPIGTRAPYYTTAGAAPRAPRLCVSCALNGALDYAEI